MSVIFSFGMLGVLVLASAWAVQLAKHFADGLDDRRQTLESLANLCDSGDLTAAEQRAVKNAAEYRLQRM